MRVEAANARQALEMVGRCDVLVVDTPGWTDKSTLALARKSTFMVIPTGPNPTYELAPTVRLLHGLRAEGIEVWRLGVVLSRFSAEEKPGTTKSSSRGPIWPRPATARLRDAFATHLLTARPWRKAMGSLKFPVPSGCAKMPAG